MLANRRQRTDGEERADVQVHAGAQVELGERQLALHRDRVRAEARVGIARDCKLRALLKRDLCALLHACSRPGGSGHGVHGTDAMYAQSARQNAGKTKSLRSQARAVCRSQGSTIWSGTAGCIGQASAAARCHQAEAALRSRHAAAVTGGKLPQEPE